MALFALADLHLSFKQPKPMDVFGPEWVDHTAKIRENWNRVVSEKDLVLVPGDISWAMYLKDALVDLNWLGELKGKKLLVRGNHDYWWSAIGRVRASLPSSIYALQNDHFTWEGRTICGTRGWICPGEEGFDSEEDQKIYAREVQRLQLSLESARRAGLSPGVAALHFPPFNRQGRASEFTELLERYEIRTCVFGHIHDRGRDRVFQGVKNGVSYLFVAADGLDFTPLLLAE